MIRSFVASLIVVMVSLIGCAPARKPIPPGVIPIGKAPTAADEEYGHQVASQLREKFPLDINNPAVDRITTVVDRLTAAAGADKQPWHVFLFRDPQFKNAAATRGNHVFVWTGMLSAVGDDNELAVVLGHEISHVLAGHTDPDPNEELKRILINVGALAAGMAVSTATHSPFAQNLGNVTSSLTNEVGNGFLINPFSRSLELEADRIGMLLMAKAGYNPDAAISFWQKALRDPDFSSSIPFFSNHPPANDRLEVLQKELPAARALYKGGAATPSTPAKPLNTSDTDFRISPPLGNLRKDQRVEGSSQLDWRVKGERCVLYEAPSKTSRPLGEFRTGALVHGIREGGNWIRVERPDTGYILKDDLIPARNEWDFRK